MWSQRVDLITGKDPVLALDDCFGNCFDPSPDFWLGEELPASVRVAVSEQHDGASRNKPRDSSVPAGDENVERPQVGGATAVSLESHFFGNHAGDSGVELGVEA